MAAETNGFGPADVTRRLRVLLHVLPLAALRRSDGMRDPALRHYDGLALALRILDVVVDRLGLEDEADRESVTRSLRPLLAAMDAAADVEPAAARHAEIVDRILGSLRNDADARRPFREEYSLIDEDGRAGRHAVEFRLLSDTFHPSGRTVLRPSPEACNLYLRLLDLDIEDAQAAAEAVVESQLARGRFDEAVHSARQARIQSVRLQEKILKILAETRRDVDRVDWREEVPRILDDARGHLERRLRVEHGILDSAGERLDALGDEDEAARRAVAQVAEMVHECQVRHTELHEHLMQARNVFLEAQGRQSFTRQPVLRLPELRDDVLLPLLALPSRTAAAALDRGFPAFLGARPPAVPDLAGLVTWMLKPRRPEPRVEVPADPVDPALLDAELRRYPPEILARAAGILAQIDGATRLSTLLARARADGLPPAVLEVLAILALQGFATEDRASAGVASERIDGRPLDDETFYGDDVMTAAIGEAHARSA